MSSTIMQSSFPFLSLPEEIRRMIYVEVLKNRCLIVGDGYPKPDLQPGVWICGNRYRRFFFRNPSLNVDSTVSLLVACRQIQTEMQLLCSAYAPSHLALSKYLHNTPSRPTRDLKELGVPFDTITKLTFNVVNLQSNPKYKRACPQLCGIGFHFEASYSYRCGGWEPDEPPKDPERLPNLGNLSRLMFMFDGFPALSELHIYDTLKHSFTAPPEPCTCPIAETNSCACGQCRCDCTPCPPPQSLIKDLEPAQARQILHKDLLFRFRAALPERKGCSIFRTSELTPGVYDGRNYSDYYALLNLLAWGVNVYLHEELKLTMSSSLPLSSISSPAPSSRGDDYDNSQSLPDSETVWRATYHLAPPQTAAAPAQPVKQVRETPGKRRKRLRLEEEAERKRTVTADGLRTWILADTMGFETHPRDLPDRVEAKPLIEYEAGLTVDVLDVDMADRDIHWKWD